MLGHRWNRLGALTAFVVGAGALGACNHTPVEGLEKSFTLKVETNTGDAEPVKIDFLWVIDNSTSMCEEQVSLTNSFSQFVDTIQQSFDIDARVAVTTVDAQCEPYSADGKVGAAKGLFNTRPASTFPPACREQRVQLCYAMGNEFAPACANFDCVVDGSCTDPDDCDCPDGGEWKCDRDPSDICLETPNGSITSTCRRTCTTDDECRTLFGDPSYRCSNGGCLLPPKTGGCPATVPAVLDNSNLDLFPCLATVGVNQEKCLKYEQGLISAQLALDKSNTATGEQATNFLRDDAYLVIIFVSDEEDCSSATPIGEDSYNTCGLLPTTDTGGPLIPVAHFVNRFKGLKSDPGRVIVAAIAGDSVSKDPATISAEREAYFAAKGHDRSCFDSTYICSSAAGKADYGSRYRDLTESFGPNGSFQNICDSADIGPALEAIADTIVSVLNKVCLPREILDGLTVKRVRSDGTEIVLTEGEGTGTYRVLLGAEDCAIDGEIMPALSFGDPPIPGEKIEIEYQGDPGFE